MKKALSAAMAAGMTAVMLAGCGSSASSAAESTAPAESTSAAASTEAAAESVVSAPTELSFVFADGDDNFKTEMNKIVDNFNAANPDITITIEPGDGGSYSEFLKTKDSVGEFPDMMEMRDTAMYVRAGKVAPLSDDIKALFTSTVEFDGVTYTAPMSGANTMGIMYNKKYFADNGLEIPKTWDEFIALCQIIKDKGDMSPLVVGGSDVWHIGFLYDLCYANDVLESDPDFIEECYKGEKDFSDPNYQKAVTDLAEVLSFAQDGWASTPDAQITTFFVNDMSAMMFSGTHMFGQINEAAPDFDYGWFAVPDRDGKINLLGGGTAGGWALSAEAAKDPDKQAAFDAFCKYFFSSDVYGEYCEQMAAIPTTVETPKMNSSEQFQAVLDALSAADYTHLMWNQEVGNRELPPDFRNFTFKTCIEVAQGSRDVASASAELQKTWNVALQSFNPTTGLGVE